MTKKLNNLATLVLALFTMMSSCKKDNETYMDTRGYFYKIDGFYAGYSTQYFGKIAIIEKDSSKIHIGESFYNNLKLDETPIAIYDIKTQSITGYINPEENKYDDLKKRMEQCMFLFNNKTILYFEQQGKSHIPQNEDFMKHF